MCSTLNKTRLAALLILFVGGCQTLPRVAPPEPLQPPIKSADAAMRARQWDPTVAVYSTGGVYAWPIYTFFHPDPLESNLNAVGETDFFLINTVCSIYWAYFSDPFWKKVLYQQLTMDPSYTANPPLPPSQSSAELPPPYLPPPVYPQPSTVRPTPPAAPSYANPSTRPASPHYPIAPQYGKQPS